jgi:hypothetical protein
LGVWLGVGNKHYIHRLVADRFLPSPTGDCVVDHIDRNKHNNCASNLRWVSHTENMENRTLELKPRQSNKSGEHHIKVILSDRQVNPSYVVMIDTKKYGKFYQCFKNLQDAVRVRDEVLNSLNNTNGL